MNRRTMYYGTQPITFQNARRLRKNMTPTEKLLWSYLSKRQLNGLRFRKQHPIGDYIADFYCHDLKLIIEVDGPMHNLKIEYDRTRTVEMAKVGLQVIRFTNDEIIADIGLAIEKIKCAIN